MLPKNFALFEQLLELGRLRGNPFGRAVVVASAGLGCRLLDELADVVPKDRDPAVELRCRKILLHALSYRSEMVVQVESGSKSTALVTSADSLAIRACFRSAVALAT
jgi:hypothetical protein